MKAMRAYIIIICEKPAVNIFYIENIWFKSFHISVRNSNIKDRTS